jgi:hypothetical protein
LLATGEIAITGAPWPRGTDTSSGNMAVLEATAVELSINAFGTRLLQRRNVDLRIDNTSVTAGYLRAIARSAPLNERIAAPLLWLRDNDIMYTATYVRSADNWADEPSRNRPTRAEAPPHVSRGEVGRVARTVNFLPTK